MQGRRECLLLLLWKVIQGVKQFTRVTAGGLEGWVKGEGVAFHNRVQIP